MARQKKISTDELFNIISKYVENKKYITKIKYSDLVIFSKELGYENIIFQDFRRNETIKSFVEKYNEEHGLSKYLKINKTQLEKVEFNVEAIVNNNSKDIKQLKTILNVYKEIYDRAFLKIEQIEIEKKEMSSTLSIIENKINLQNSELNEAKKANKLLRQELSDLKNKIKKDKKNSEQEWIIIAIEYLLKKKRILIQDEIQLIDILKNLGYRDNNELIDVDKIIKNLNEENCSNEIKKVENNISNINNKKLKVPKFMKCIKNDN